MDYARQDIKSSSPDKSTHAYSKARSGEKPGHPNGERRGQIALCCILITKLNGDDISLKLQKLYHVNI